MDAEKITQDSYVKQKKKTDDVIYVIILLNVFIILVQLYTFFYNSEFNHFLGDFQNVLDLREFIPTVTFVLLITTVFLLIKLKEIHGIALESVEIRQQNESSRLLLQQYRSSIHEFLNHMQVVYGFIQISQPERALEYIKDYDIRFRKGISIKGVARPEVVAILVSKITSNIGEDTRFEHIVKDDLSRLPLSVSEAVTLIGNLVQNALDAVSSCDDPQQKYIRVEFESKHQNTIIRVVNGGVGIPQEHLDKLFEFGYTSKKDKPISGVGLSLVKNIVDKYKGMVDIQSKFGQTTFEVTIPSK